MAVKAVIYARFSPRPDADESQSNAKQIERGREWAAEHGYEVSEDRIFFDEALTGADDEKHPDPLRALSKRKGIVQAIEATGKGMVLIVRWRSRIARDPYVQQAVERIVGGQGGRVEATDESNETGLAGELTRGVLATVAKYEVIKIRLLTALAMKKHQQNGIRMTRKDRCPFGWAASPNLPNTLVEQKAEQVTIRKIMQYHAEGVNPNRICSLLDKAGIRHRGKLWKKNRNLVISIIEREKERWGKAASEADALMARGVESIEPEAVEAARDFEAVEVVEAAVEAGPMPTAEQESEPEPEQTPTLDMTQTSWGIGNLGGFGGFDTLDGINQG